MPANIYIAAYYLTALYPDQEASALCEVESNTGVRNLNEFISA